jgi:hypothetical protein
VNINIYIHTSTPLYAACHCACHSCRPPASNARRRRPSAARSPALPLLACSRGCQPGSRQSQHLLQPSISHPSAHAPDTHIAIAISLPSPIHPHPFAIAASLRRHLRLCVPSRAYQSNPKHVCRSKGWRCTCNHRASTSLLSSTSIHIAPFAISPGSRHHRLTTAITIRDPSIDPQMAP